MRVAGPPTAGNSQKSSPVAKVGLNYFKHLARERLGGKRDFVRFIRALGTESKRLCPRAAVMIPKVSGIIGRAASIDTAALWAR
jgi:hypothetical protein